MEPREVWWNREQTDNLDQTAPERAAAEQRTGRLTGLNLPRASVSRTDLISSLTPSFLTLNEPDEQQNQTLTTAADCWSCARFAVLQQSSGSRTTKYGAVFTLFALQSLSACRPQMNSYVQHKHLQESSVSRIKQMTVNYDRVCLVLRSLPYCSVR